MNRCFHWPTNGKGYGADNVNGERSTCGHCGREIRWVEGYENRRDYWATLPKKKVA